MVGCATFAVLGLISSRNETLLETSVYDCDGHYVVGSVM